MWFDDEYFALKSFVKDKAKASKKTKKRREQRSRQKMRNMTPAEVKYHLNGPTLGDILGCKTTAQSAANVPVKKMETTMYVDYISSDKHNESSKTNYLLARLENLKYKHRNAFAKQFGLENDSTPYKAKDLVDRILAGKYILPTDKEESLSSMYFGNGALAAITWRDPAIVKDQAGYDLAVTALEDETVDVQDAIMSGIYADGISALNAFKTWTPTPAAA